MDEPNALLKANFMYVSLYLGSSTRATDHPGHAACIYTSVTASAKARTFATCFAALVVLVVVVRASSDRRTSLILKNSRRQRFDVGLVGAEILRML